MALPQQLKIALDAYWAEEVEPYVRYAASPEEIDNGLYSFSGEAERLMSGGGYSYAERDAGWAYLESLANQYKIEKGFVVEGTKPAGLSPSGPGTGLRLIASLASGLISGGAAYFVVKALAD